MRFSEKIHNSGNKIVSTSTDMHIFNYPNYTVDGMVGDIGEIGPITIEDDFVYVLEGENDLELKINFIDNLEYLKLNTKFNYQILNYDGIKFNSDSVFDSVIFDYVEGEEYVDVINASNLPFEGEYILKLGYQYDSQTEVAKRFGKRNISTTYNKQLPYGNYDKSFDKYFILLYAAQLPRLDIGVIDDNVNGDKTENTSKDSLQIKPLEVVGGVSEYAINIKSNSDMIVIWRGSILTLGEDYTIKNKVLKFKFKIHRDDLINLLFIGKSNTSDLRTKTFKVKAPVSEGPKDGEGTNDVYFNTDSEKYEIYTDNGITDVGNVIINLNGVTLTNDVDFLVSTTNNKRIILQGEIRYGDILTVIYSSGENQIRTVTEGYVDIRWFVDNALSGKNGMFTIQFSKTKEFINIDKEIEVPYIKDLTKFGKRVEMDYEYNSVIFYRIKNNKEYETINGDVLKTQKFSDSIRLDIKTNKANNY